jgi:glycosyltransferase involved in cell wall biosynthesis
MHVAFLNPVGTLGGAERVLVTAVAALRETDPAIQVSVLAAGDGPLLDAVKALGADVVRIPMPAALSGLTDSGTARSGMFELLGSWAELAQAVLEYRAQLSKVLNDLRPDVIHSNAIKMHLLAALARPRGTAVVWHIHDFVGLRFLTPWLLRLARRNVHAIAISHAVARDIRSVLPGIKATVIHNAIDARFFEANAAASASLENLAGFPEADSQTIRVGLIATYALWKGHDVFLEAVARLYRVRQLPPCTFFIVGGPVYQTRAQRTQAELRATAEKLKISERVGFIGFQTEIAPIYRALDVVVHASTQPEPFGLTIAEAMACGRAVVVSQAGGAAEICTPEHDSIAVVPGDIHGLAEAIYRLISDRSLRQRLGENARLSAMRRFQPARFGSQLLEVYADAISRTQMEPRMIR